MRTSAVVDDGTGCGVSSQVECGNATVYCPPLSTSPLPVPPGRYSVGGSSSSTRSGTVDCPSAAVYGRGVFCVGDDVIRTCPAGSLAVSNETSLASPLCSGVCPPGYFCREGCTELTVQPCGGAQW
jgi:hypothetical protein